MDTATAIATARKVAKMADKVIKYIKADNEAAYGLDEEVTVLLEGEDVASIGGTLTQLTEYTTKDGSLTVETPSAFGISLTAHPFPASARLWNGPDVIADNQYRSMLASLFHDLIWGHADELARAWGVSKRDVLTWGNGVLYALWMFASADSVRGRIEARLAWIACEFSKSWYHRFKKWAGLYCLATAFGLAAAWGAAGCGSPPDWRVAEISGTNAVLRAMGRGGAGDGGAEVVGNPDTLPTVAGNATDDAGAEADAVEFAALDWCWGGFDGSKAKRADGCEIGALKVTTIGLSYKWARGGCEALGAASATDAACLACLFVRVGGAWRGGKFDWISTSRNSRDFKNIREGYNGWRGDAIERAEAFAFVIISKDGRKRSNVACSAK